MEHVRSGSPFERMAAYSRATRVRDHVAVSGTAALDDRGAALHPGDAGRQTQVAFERALDAAAALGAGRDDVMRTRIFLELGADWRAAVEAHGVIFEGVDPANTTLFVSGFIPEGCVVEVEVDAVASGPSAE